MVVAGAVAFVAAFLSNVLLFALRQIVYQLVENGIDMPYDIVRLVCWIGGVGDVVIIAGWIFVFWLRLKVWPAIIITLGWIQIIVCLFLLSATAQIIYRLPVL